MDITTNKTYKRYDYISRYEPYPYYYNTMDKRYFYGITSWLQTDNVPFVLHEAKIGESYDSIAFDHYGAPIFYWVILDFNRIRDPFEPLVPGTKLKLPAMNGLAFKEI